MSSAAATPVSRLEALFRDVRLDGPRQGRRPSDVIVVESRVQSRNCEVHGCAATRRGSVANLAGRRRSSVGPRRESMPALNSLSSAAAQRRSSLALSTPPARRDVVLVHPSAFPGTLRRDSIAKSMGSLVRRDSLARSTGSLLRRDGHGGSAAVLRKDSAVGSSTSSLRRDSVGSSVGSGRRDSVGSSSVASSRRRFSTDSLDSIRRSSYDIHGSRRFSCSSDDPLWEDIIKAPQPATAVGDADLNGSVGSGGGPGRPRFVAVTTLEDVQAVRCAEFHPQGRLYAVGSNSKTLRICSYPKLSDLREDHATYQPTVLFKRTKHHKGSIYCLAWTPIGDLMATGSNDKTLKLMRFNADTSNLEGQEIELTMHDGTVRDLCFLEDTTNKSSLLISGGAGDCKIYVTDCATGTSFLALSGHSGHVLTLYNWGGAMFVSGSQDKTVRFWDLRTRGCVNMVTPATAPGNRGSPVTAVCVDPSGRLLVSGHEDSSCVLYDIRGGRNVQCFKPHSAEVRSIRFSPSAYYLLTGGYDNKLVLTDLQGDLTLPLPSVVVAQHQDKVISGRWHPTEFSFLSTSADKTATLWALPPV